MQDLIIDLTKVDENKITFESIKTELLENNVHRRYLLDVFGIKESGSYPCPLHKGKKHNFQVDLNADLYTCHSHSCIYGGDIIELCKIKEGFSGRYKAMKYLAEMYGIDIPTITSQKANRVNKTAIVDYYKQEQKQAYETKDYNTALSLEFKMEAEKNNNYYIQFPFVDMKNTPLKIWENVEVLLDKNNIIPVYNTISKAVEVKGLDSEGLPNQISDIHSLTLKYGLGMTFNNLHTHINRIASKNSFNPVTDFLQGCHLAWDGKRGRIDNIINSLITPVDFDLDLKKLLIVKWLLTCCKIAFNTGTYNTEGMLVLDGKQGLGKTRWIANLLPDEDYSDIRKYLKTGKEIDPSDKDKIYQMIKYWIVEIGELGATLKRYKDKLKQFITESKDELRLPYAVAPMIFPRTTALIGTVNNGEFLKDETGSRRYWVIPITDIDFSIIDAMDNTDKCHLWGEIMEMYLNNEIPTYLNKEELDMLSESNKQFNIKNDADIQLDHIFDWSITNQDKWVLMKGVEVAKIIGVKSTKGLKEAIESAGGIYIRKTNYRGYLMPPPKKEYSFL